MVKVELVDLYKVKLEIAKIIMNNMDSINSYDKLIVRRAKELSNDTVIHEYVFNDNFTEYDLVQFANCISDHKADTKIAWPNAKSSDSIEIPVDVIIPGIEVIYKYKIVIYKDDNSVYAQLLLI